VIVWLSNYINAHICVLSSSSFVCLHFCATIQHHHNFNTQESRSIVLFKYSCVILHGICTIIDCMWLELL
jgi:hypothetical protein